MSEENIKLVQRWNIIKEQLIALCVLSKLPNGNDDFQKFLDQGLELKNLNTQTLNTLFYYILGVINFEERNKLIQWPLVNIKTHTRFRKGLSTMIIDLQKKYPWAHIKKLPESYFLNPRGHKSKVIDFTSRMINLAIHLALDDPELLFMQSGDGMIPREVTIMTEVITKEREKEEQVMQRNVVPLDEADEVKNEICNKCIVLKHEISELQQRLNCLKKHALNAKTIPNKDQIDCNVLKEEINRKLLKLNTTNEELLKYFNVSKELCTKLKAFNDQSSLTTTNFGSQDSPLDLSSSTSKVCEELCQFFQSITLSNSTKEVEGDFCQRLKHLKESLHQQNKALQSLLCNVSLG